MKMKYDMTPFFQRLKNKYIQWKWDRKERKTKLYDQNSKFITYAHKNGFFHSPFHYAKRMIDYAPLIGNPDFNEIFSILIKGGILTPIRKDKVI